MLFKQHTENKTKVSPSQHLFEILPVRKTVFSFGLNTELFYSINNLITT